MEIASTTASPRESCARQDSGFHRFPQFWNTQKKTVPSEEKGRDWRPHRPCTSRARTPEGQSRSSPVTWGHHCIAWGDTELRAQSCPSRLEGRSCRAQGRYRTPECQLPAPPPRRAPAGPEVRAAPPTHWSPRLQSCPRGSEIAPRPPPAGSKQHSAPLSGSPGLHTHHF